jgi:DsbC/DsbD-like thiol-disulfide interchange protein
MTRSFFALLALGAVGALVSSNLRAGGDESPVKITHTVGKADSAGKQKVTFAIDIKEGWHVYANPVGDEDYAPNAIQVKAKGATIKVTYPPGKPKTEVENGKTRTFNIYKGQVQIVAEVTRAANTPAELTVQYNACDKDRCLPTKREKFKIE